jgi:hypothetical protein
MEPAKVLLPDAYKDRIDHADMQMRLNALSMAVDAHKAGDFKKDVADKAVSYLAFLKTGEFPSAR